jgi:hypothetical protein
MDFSLQLDRRSTETRSAASFPSEHSRIFSGGAVGLGFLFLSSAVPLRCWKPGNCQAGALIVAAQPWVAAHATDVEGQRGSRRRLWGKESFRTSWAHCTMACSMSVASQHVSKYIRPIASRECDRTVRRAGTLQLDLTEATALPPSSVANFHSL